MFRVRSIATRAGRTRCPRVPALADVVARNAGVSATFNDLERNPRVVVVQPAPFLCDPNCRYTYRGRPLYYDDDHLSVFAAKEKMAPFLTERVFGAAFVRPAADDQPGLVRSVTPSDDHILVGWSAAASGE
jgi:hypothetical protein